MYQKQKMVFVKVHNAEIRFDNKNKGVLKCDVINQSIVWVSD